MAPPEGYPGVRFITAGTDGNEWFTEYRAERVGRITPSGRVTEFPVPTRADGFSEWPIVSGPNGNIWFGENGAEDGVTVIGCVTPRGIITQYPISVTVGIGPITAGADGNIWFTVLRPSSQPTERAYLGRMTPRGVVTTFPLPRGVDDPNILVAGPGKALWFAVPSGIGRMTTQGLVRMFPITVEVSEMTLGSDGNLWIAQGLENRIGRLTYDGHLTEYPLSVPSDQHQPITTGPDGNVWFAMGSVSSADGGNMPDAPRELGRITPRGKITYYTAPVIGELGPGPDGNIWATGGYVEEILRITPQGKIIRFGFDFHQTYSGRDSSEQQAAGAVR